MIADRHPRISIDPNVCHGKPVIKGTRIMVSTVLGRIAGGDAINDTAQDLAIDQEDVRAAVAYAQELLDQERHYPLSA